VTMPSLGSPMVLIALTTRLVQNSTSCGQFHIMREFRLCSKSHNAQYSSTKIKAIPMHTDNAIQEMLENSFLISARKELCLKDLPWYACNRGVVGT